MLVGKATLAAVLDAARYAACSVSPMPPEQKTSGEWRFRLLTVGGKTQASAYATEYFIRRLLALNPDAEIRTSKVRYKGLDDYRARNGLARK